MAHFEKTADQGAGYATLTESTPNLQWFRAFLLIVIALCTYAHVPLTSGGRLLVPSFPTVALTPLLFLMVRPNLLMTDRIFLPKIAFVLLMSIACSPGYKYLGEKFFGLIQCCMAISVAVLIVRLMQQIRPTLLERALLVLWCLIVVGAVLEVLGVIRDFSDSFRAWAYATEYTLYDSDLRDTSLVGWPRPKLFSVEPSHVTKFFIASINAWLLVRISWSKVAIVAGSTLVMFLIMGSPMLIISAAITLTILLWNRRATVRARVAMIFAALLIGVLFVSFFGGSTYSNVWTRLADFDEASRAQTARPDSEQQRMVYPYLTLIETWARWPLFGVGVSGEEVVAENTTLRVDPKFALGNNALAEIGTFLGLVGGAWFVYLLAMQANRTGVHRLGLVLAIGALFSQLMAGMVSFRYWGFIALLWGALAVADIHADGDARSTR